MFYAQAEKGLLGWSSGTAPHLVERVLQDNGTNEITLWPLGDDASLTAIPAEPRTKVLALKTYLEMAEPHVKALLPQDAATKAASADATKAQPEPDQSTLKDYYEVTPTMTPEEIQALIEQTSQATIKAYEAKLAAEPPINPAGVAVTQPATVKSKPEGFKSLGEQLLAIKNASLGYGYDRRLDSTKAILGGNESIPSEGGFLVSTAEDAGLDKKVWETGVFANRAELRTLPAGSNSANFYGISENSRANGSRYGGVTGYRMAEGATITQSTVQNFYQYTWKPKKYGAVAYLTDEVLNDARLTAGLVNSVIVALASRRAAISRRTLGS
jgi:HK97 family phage major capsid protein